MQIHDHDAPVQLYASTYEWAPYAGQLRVSLYGAGVQADVLLSADEEDRLLGLLLDRRQRDDDV